MNIKWNDETVALEAKKYDNKNDFRVQSSGAYNYARRNKIYTDVTTHMVANLSLLWTAEAVATEAKKYTTREGFRRGSAGAYKYAKREGLLETIQAHMPSTRWSYKKTLDEAKKYTTKKEWVEAGGGSYNYAKKKGILDEVSAHMVTPDSAISDEDMVYLWRIPNTNICKIGLSSVRRGDGRIVEVAESLEVDYEILTMCHVPNARGVEAELHREYQIVPTTLPKVNGSTEFRVLSEANINEITYYLENIVGDVL